MDNRPTRNAAKAGSAIPVKFSLEENMRLANSSPISAIEQNVTAGGSSLSVRAASGQSTLQSRIRNSEVSRIAREALIPLLMTREWKIRFAGFLKKIGASTN